MFFTKAFWIGGTALFGAASVLAGRAIFGSQQNETIFIEKVDQLKAQMVRFADELNDGDVVPVGNFPMPGETMLWLTPKDGRQWKAKFQLLKDSGKELKDVKNENGLKKWCQIQKSVTRVHIVKQPGQSLKVKMSLDATTTYSHPVQASDLHDLKTYCSRSITNKEWFGVTFRSHSPIEVNGLPVSGKAQTCSYWATQPYSKNNEDKLNVCLKFLTSEKLEVVDQGDE